MRVFVRSKQRSLSAVQQSSQSIKVAITTVPISSMAEAWSRQMAQRETFVIWGLHTEPKSEDKNMLAVADHLYTALFSVLEHTRCTLCCRRRLQMSDCSFLQRALSVHQSGVVAALFGSYVAGATRNCCHLGICVHHTTMHHIASLQAKPQLLLHCQTE